MQLTRRQQPVTYVASSTQIVQLLKSNFYRDIALRHTGQPTITAANNTRAKTKNGDEWAVVQRVRLVANSSDVLLDVTGNQLWWINRDLYGVNPLVCSTLGDATTANPSFDSVLLIPLELVRGGKRHDSVLDSGEFTDLRLEITWGSHTSINADATGFTTAPQIEIESYKHEDNGKHQPMFVSRIVSTQAVLSAAASAYRFNLDVGPAYRGFLFNTANSSGVDTTGLVTNVKLVSGSTVLREFSESMLLQYGNIKHGLHSGVLSLPNCGITALTDSTGRTAVNTIANHADLSTYATDAANIETNVSSLAGKINEIISFLNGRSAQVNHRQSADANPRAWYSLDLAPDGYMSEAINSGKLNEFYLELAVSGAATINVIGYQIFRKGQI